MEDFVLDNRLDITNRPRITSLTWRKNILLFFLFFYFLFKVLEALILIFPYSTHSLVSNTDLNVYLIVHVGLSYVQIIITVLSLTFWIIAILIAIWFYGVYVNLASSRLKLNGTMNMAAIGFFIPLLNFVHPYYTMSEAWNGTQFLAGKIAKRWKAQKTPKFILIWWLSFVFSYFLLLFAGVNNNTIIYSLHYILNFTSLTILIYLVIRISRVHIELNEGIRDFPEPKRVRDDNITKEK